jgi:hypothetical protein
MSSITSIINAVGHVGEAVGRVVHQASIPLSLIAISSLLGLSYYFYSGVSENPEFCKSLTGVVWSDYDRAMCSGVQQNIEPIVRVACNLFGCAKFTRPAFNI